MAIFKTEINVVGVGERRQGTSQKNGKPYDMVNIAFTYPDPYQATKGLLAASAPMNGAQYEMCPVSPGDTIEVILSTYQGKTSIATVL